MYCCLHYSASGWICSTYAALLFKYTTPSLTRLHISLSLSLIISPDMSLWRPVISHTNTHTHTHTHIYTIPWQCSSTQWCTHGSCGSIMHSEQIQTHLNLCSNTHLGIVSYMYNFLFYRKKIIHKWPDEILTCNVSLKPSVLCLLIFSQNIYEQLAGWIFFTRCILYISWKWSFGVHVHVFSAVLSKMLFPPIPHQCHIRVSVCLTA